MFDKEIVPVSRIKKFGTYLIRDNTRCAACRYVAAIAPGNDMRKIVNMREDAPLVLVCADIIPQTDKVCVRLALPVTENDVYEMKKIIEDKRSTNVNGTYTSRYFDFNISTEGNTNALYMSIVETNGKTIRQMFKRMTSSDDLQLWYDMLNRVSA